MRRHKANRLIAVLTLFLMGVGLIVIYAIGPMRANFMNSAYGLDYDTNYFFVHQLISVSLAVAAFVFGYIFPYAKLRTFAKAIIVAGLLACALLALLAFAGSSLASCQLGACRWFNLGGLGSFQPAEILKFGLILYLAQLIAERRAEGKLETRDFWQPFGIITILACGFVVVLQKDLGTGMVLIAIILSMLFMSGISLRQFLIVLLVIAVGGVLAIISSPHRIQRIMTFGQEDGSDSYHIDNAILAIGTGGLTGVGIGNSVQATGYLPESINDSVFAVMGETFGFIGLMVIVGCFAVLLMQLLKVSDHLQDLEQSLVVVGVFAWMLTHVLVNIGAMTGIIPLTGITLPLLSYGGTSMLFLSLALGVSLQLSCYTSREVRRNEDISSRRGFRGTHYTSRRGSPQDFGN